MSSASRDNRVPGELLQGVPHTDVVGDAAGENQVGFQGNAAEQVDHATCGRQVNSRGNVFARFAPGPQRDDFRLGKNDALAADRQVLLCLQRGGADLADRVFQQSGGLFQKPPGAGGALVVHENFDTLPVLGRRG